MTKTEYKHSPSKLSGKTHCSTQNEFDYNKPMVFGYDENDKELGYIHNYFAKNKKDNSVKKNNLGDNDSVDYVDSSLQVEGYQNRGLTITINERNIIIQAIQFDGGFIMSFGKNSEIIKSLYKKGFVKKSDKLNHFYEITKNIRLLVEIEGVKAFDEIVKN